MKGGIYLCDHCWRVLEPRETRVVQSEVGGIRVPLAHTDESGGQCDGTRSEVIHGWGRPAQEQSA